MTTPANPGASGRDALPLDPKLAPGQGLPRLLELIRTSRQLADFTSERVSQAMGVDMQPSSRNAGDYSFYEPVTSEWLQGLDFSRQHQRLRFSFDPVQPGTSPDLASVCQFDFDQFASALEAGGFKRSQNLGEHGRLLGYTFERMRDGKPEMRLEITPEGAQAGSDGTATSRSCIRTIYVY